MGTLWFWFQGAMEGLDDLSGGRLCGPIKPEWGKGFEQPLGATDGTEWVPFADELQGRMLRCVTPGARMNEVRPDPRIVRP